MGNMINSSHKYL